ncbi:MAG: helicase RepA family protein, partial [Aquificaceae bacterium]|nr:helicase RepA family protein [Aquificaceae bacterium]
RDKPLLLNLGVWIDSYDSLNLEWIPLLGIDGILARGATTLIAAHPKAGKTTLLAHACRDWAKRGLAVVYLTEEPPIVWKLRIQRFPELRNLYVSAIPRAHPENWSKAIRTLEPAPDVVVVDTIRRFGGISDEADAAKVAYALSHFVDLTRYLPRTAIVIAHHTRKGVKAQSEASVDDIAGSHAFAGEVDSILTLLKNPKHERQRLLKPVEGRLWVSAPEALVLELSEDGSEYCIVGTAEEILSEQQRNDSRRMVIDAVRALSEATAQDVMEYLDGELSRRQVYNLLNALEREGALETADSVDTRGRRAKVYRVKAHSPTSPFVQSTFVQLHKGIAQSPPEEPPPFVQSTDSIGNCTIAQSPPEGESSANFEFKIAPEEPPPFVQSLCNP